MKKPVKVYLSSREIELLDRVCSRLGQDRSSLLRTAFLSYAKDLSLMKEYVHNQE